MAFSGIVTNREAGLGTVIVSNLGVLWDNWEIIHWIQNQFVIGNWMTESTLCLRNLVNVYWEIAPTLQWKLRIGSISERMSDLLTETFEIIGYIKNFVYKYTFRFVYFMYFSLSCFLIWATYLITNRWQSSRQSTSKWWCQFNNKAHVLLPTLRTF